MADNVIPFNADKILFAHDLVNTVFGTDIEVHVFHFTQDFREFIYQGFTETVRIAAVHLERTLGKEVETIFYGLLEEDKVGETDFISYGEGLRNEYFSEGFDADNFLNFCVHIASMATHLYDDGLQNAPQLAVDLILDSFKDYDMFNGGWDSVQSIAENYQRTFLALTTTPRSSLSTSPLSSSSPESP